MPNNLFAMDYRPSDLSTGSAVSYVTRSDEWKPVSDPQIRMLVKIANREKNGGHVETPSRSRFIPLFLILFISSLFLGIIIKKKKIYD